MELLITGRIAKERKCPFWGSLAHEPCKTRNGTPRDTMHEARYKVEKEDVNAP